MGLPDIVIEFSKKAIVAIQSGTLGVVGTILKVEELVGSPMEIVLLVRQIQSILREPLRVLPAK